ncbi:hypothetical protein NO391_12520 [Escherichia coli]|nr:hypothetical protein [Escherichia coli]
MINYLTAKDAAEYLGVCLSRFYQLKRYIRSFPPYINQTINGRKRRVWLASSLDQFADRFLGGTKMSTLTRSQVATNIRDILLSGRKLTPKEFDDILRKAGNHERSRVLTLLRNDWGIPVEQFKTEAYHVTERNLEAYHSDKDETLKIWRTNARYVKTLRKVNITLSLLRGLVGKVPEDTLRTVYKGIETKYL